MAMKSYVRKKWCLRALNIEVLAPWSPADPNAIANVARRADTGFVIKLNKNYLSVTLTCVHSILIADTGPGLCMPLPLAGFKSTSSLRFRCFQSNTARGCWYCIANDSLIMCYCIHRVMGRIFISTLATSSTHLWMVYEQSRRKIKILFSGRSMTE
jgi:hypothetical protein